MAGFFVGRDRCKPIRATPPTHASLSLAHDLPLATVTPTRTYKDDSGTYCREYQTTVTVGGEEQKAYGTACRQPDGQWKIMS